MYGFLLLFVLIAELPDFSRAGCEIDIANEIPNTEVNITDFGAIANDNTDDAEAITQQLTRFLVMGAQCTSQKGDGL